jgi:hypothetical protein
MKTSNRILKSILLFFLIVPLIIAAQKEEPDREKIIEFHGYIKDLNSFTVTDHFDSLDYVNLLHNRLNFSFNFSPKFKGRLEIRNRIFFGDLWKQAPDFGKLINQGDELMSLSKLWVNHSNLVIQSVIDRGWLQYVSGKWDIKLGRQRINWGLNNTWNPNDIFNAFNFLDFDYEERPGADALRIQRTLKNNSVMELAYKPGKNKNMHVGALLYRFNKNKFDFQTLAGIWRQDIVAGGGWAGSIEEAGFKGEFSYFHPQKKFLDTSGTLSFSIMVDQTFKKDWYVTLSFLFNTNPDALINGSPPVINSALTAKTLFPYRYTFFIQAVKSFTVISSLSCSVIYSPEKNSLILFPVFTWNAAKNFDVDLASQTFFASKPGDYKMQGAAFYLRGKWNF